MIVHAYTLTRNEAEILPFYFKNYEFVNRFFISDHNSTDGTMEILKSNPKVTMLPCIYKDENINEYRLLDWKNNIWRNSIGKADLVIIGDCDEFLFHPYLYRFLELNVTYGRTIFPTSGYEMVSDPFFKIPEFSGTPLTEIVNTGFRYDLWSKTLAFCPGKITDIDYYPGCHKCNPRGEVRPATTKINMLHYKHLGVTRHVLRCMDNASRLSRQNIEKNYGIHYLGNGLELAENYHDNFYRSIPVDLRTYPEVKRWDIINALAKKVNAKTYLEIGYRDGSCFRNIQIPCKTGVDPFPKDIVAMKMTSDDFFAKNSDAKFDVIFIDGLHEKEQFERDVFNSMNALNENGAIICHDCNPLNEHQQIPDPDNSGKPWLGTTWKGWANIEHNGFIIDADFGCGVIIGRQKLTRKNLNISYPELDKNRSKYLNIISIEQFKKMMGE